MSAVTTDVSLEVVRVGLLGFGVVGQAFVRRATLASVRLGEAGVLVRCVGALVRDPGKPRSAPDLPLWLSASAVPWRECDVVVEALGGVEPARSLVRQALEAGVPVVTANKSLIAAHGAELIACAEAHGTTLLFEAAVLAGVPCVNTLVRRPLASAAAQWAGILNGTSHFVLTRIKQGLTFDEAVLEAVDRGYAEPANDADLSGRDAAEKLAILLHLAGYRDVTPATFPRLAVSEIGPWHLQAARSLGGTLKPVAVARPTGAAPGAWVGPAWVDRDHAFADCRGITNILTVGDGDGAVTFRGPGAGPDVTAATLLDDVVEVVTGRMGPHLAVRYTASGADALRVPPAGAWFVAGDGVIAGAGDLAEFLAARHVPLIRIIGDATRLAALTAPCAARTVAAATAELVASGTSVVSLPALGEVDRG